MPAGSVTIEAIFEALPGGISFTDVPSNTWYYSAV